MQVRGVGLVRGLSGKGSTSCPESIRKDLISEIRKLYLANPDAEPTLTPEQLIDSRNTAAVMVEAVIPFGMSKGERFDVLVRAVDQETRFVSGGYLMQCDLRIVKDISPRQSVAGRVHSRASGPIFINPFVSTKGEKRVAGAREGTIIGGGVNLINRRLSLVTTIESYATVRQVADAINERFGEKPKTANAVSPTNVELTIPPAYFGKAQRFVSLVTYLPLTRSHIELENRANTLVGELSREDTPREHISLALEGIGITVLPMIQRLYTDPRREVNYYAARTGLRLGNDLAVDVINRHATDKRSPFRLPAIRELGDCAMTARAGKVLGELLMSPDTRIRIVAYEALRKVDRGSMANIAVGQESKNFILDIVPSEGPVMIYVRKSKARRIAMIGGDRMEFKPPLLYSEVDKPITLSAGVGDRMLTVMRKDSSGNVVVKPFKAPLSVPKLVQFMGDDPIKNYDGRLKGLGIDYTIILDMLYRLCEKKAIDAEFHWEEPSIEEMIGGPLEPIGRPESEL
jgi:hypothetical protein